MITPQNRVRGCLSPSDFGITDHTRCWPEGAWHALCDECWKRVNGCALCTAKRQIGPTGVRIAGGVRILNPDGSLSVRYFVCAEHAAFVEGLGY